MPHICDDLGVEEGSNSDGNQGAGSGDNRREEVGYGDVARDGEDHAECDLDNMVNRRVRRFILISALEL